MNLFTKQLYLHFAADGFKRSLTMLLRICFDTENVHVCFNVRHRRWETSAKTIVTLRRGIVLNLEYGFRRIDSGNAQKNIIPVPGGNKTPTGKMTAIRRVLPITDAYPKVSQDYDHEYHRAPTRDTYTRYLHADVYYYIYVQTLSRFIISFFFFRGKYCRA